MSGAVALIALYTGLVGSVGGLLFARIDAWCRRVRSFRATIKKMEKRADAQDKFRDQLLNSEELRATKPTGSLILLVILLSGLTLLGWWLPITNASVNPVVVVRVPFTVVAVGAGLGGFGLLDKGENLLKEAEKIIRDVLK